MKNRYGWPSKFYFVYLFCSLFKQKNSDLLVFENICKIYLVFICIFLKCEFCYRWNVRMLLLSNEASSCPMSQDLITKYQKLKKGLSRCQRSLLMLKWIDFPFSRCKAFLQCFFLKIAFEELRGKLHQKWNYFWKTIGNIWKFLW